MLKGKLSASYQKLVDFYGSVEEYRNNPCQPHNLRESTLQENYSKHGKRVLTLYKTKDLKEYLRSAGTKGVYKMKGPEVIETVDDLLSQRQEYRKRKKRKLPQTESTSLSMTNETSLQPPKKKKKTVYKQYTVKFKQGKHVTRTISIMGKSSIDELVKFGLDQFNFDFSHLYELTLENGDCVKGPEWAGKSLLINNGYLRNNIFQGNCTIQGLEITKGDVLTLNYDGWVFILVVTGCAEVSSKEIPKLIDRKRSAPDQYDC